MSPVNRPAAEPVALFHTDTGPRDGAAVLLVHGWGSDHRTWDGIELPGRRVVAVDLRGHGRSPVPERGYRPTDLAGDLVALIERLDLGPVVAVGHSMGAQVVTALAVEHPDLVAALVAADPAYGADDAEQELIPGRLAALRADGGAAAVAMFGLAQGRIKDQFLATPGFVLAECYAGMYTDPGAFGTRQAAEDYLPRRRCPVLSIWSMEELAAWERTIARPAGSRLVGWGGVSHYLHRDRPVAFAREIQTWLGTQDPAPVHQTSGAAE